MRLELGDGDVIIQIVELVVLRVQRLHGDRDRHFGLAKRSTLVKIIRPNEIQADFVLRKIRETLQKNAESLAAQMSGVECGIESKPF